MDEVKNSVTDEEIVKEINNERHQRINYKKFFKIIFSVMVILVGIFYILR